MENQHKKITGYRDLTQLEIDLMNEGKELAVRCHEFHDKLFAMSAAPSIDPGGTSEPDTIDKRWLAIAKTDLQKGFMSLVRAIAKPTSF